MPAISDWACAVRLLAPKAFYIVYFGSPCVIIGNVACIYWASISLGKYAESRGKYAESIGIWKIFILLILQNRIDDIKLCIKQFNYAFMSPNYQININSATFRRYHGWEQFEGMWWWMDLATLQVAPSYPQTTSWPVPIVSQGALIYLAKFLLIQKISHFFSFKWKLLALVRWR